MDWDLGGCRENMFTGPMRCRQANLHHKYLLFLVHLPFTSMQSRTFKANNYLKKKYQPGLVQGSEAKLCTTPIHICLCRGRGKLEFSIK